MTQEVAFGKSVSFRAEVSATAPPRSVWLIYRLAEEWAENIGAATVTGNGPYSATWLWELFPGQMAPGATVFYRWSVELADGSRIESEEQSFRYDDARFKWQSTQNGQLSVLYYKNANLANSVLAAGTEALARLADAIGYSSDAPIYVYIYASEGDMGLALPSRSQTYDAATVTLGMAMSEDTVLLLGRASDAETTVMHELSHIVVGRATDTPFSDVPRWLDEGLAMYAEGKLPADNASSLDQAVRADRLISLRSMTSYPGDASLVDLFYGEAYSIVAYMLDTYGADSMRELLGQLGQGTPIEEALATAHGISLADLETGWRASLGLGPRAEVPSPKVPTAVHGSLRPSSALPSGAERLRPAA